MGNFVIHDEKDNGRGDKQRVRSKEIDFEKALPQCRSAAESGDTDAMRALGDLYAAGKGVAQNFDEAIAWYKKAANAGNVDAMLKVGTIYAKGKGIKQNHNEAIAWYQMAADAGSTGALIAMGRLYTKGEKKNYNKALEYYQMAADAGNTVAMIAMGELYAAGDKKGSGRNGRGRGRGRGKKGRKGFPQDYNKALECFRKAAEKGNVEALNLLADKHFHGEWGLFKNPDVAIELLRKAGKSGNVKAMSNLGRIYANGEMDVLQNDREAAYWLNKAAQSEGAKEMRCLGDFYLSREYDKYYPNSIDLEDLYQDFVFDTAVVKRRIHKGNVQAIKWYRKAAALGDTSAMTRLGVEYVCGKAVSRDVQEGMKFLKEALNKPLNRGFHLSTEIRR